jgi:predicted Zn-dependent protease
MGLLGAGAKYGSTLPFNRKQESEADHIGLLYMARAGYDPRESVGFWQRMQDQKSSGAPSEFLSTHPSHDTRIHDLQKWMPEALKEYSQQNQHNAPAA